MGLFSDLSSLGIDDAANIDIFGGQSVEGVEDEVKEEDVVFEKKMNCPCCGNEFGTLVVRGSKVHAIGQDYDLRPLVKEVDPVKYDAVICTICGYGSLYKTFNTLFPEHRELILAKITPKFMGFDYENNKYSYDEAIMRYKMLLLNDVVCNASNGQKAYTCLKLSWLIRGQLETEGDTLDDATRKKLIADEKDSLNKAYSGFKLALAEGRFPICGMDENTLKFLLAAVAYRLNEYAESSKLLHPILVDRTVSAKIQAKAVKLKEMLMVYLNVDEEDK